MIEIIIDYNNLALFHYLKAAAPAGLSFVSDIPLESRNSSVAGPCQFRVEIDLNFISIEIAVSWLVNRSRKSGQLFDFKIGNKNICIADQKAIPRILKELNSTNRA